jgi:hypothetical protein
MTREERRALHTLIADDPRVRQLVEQRKRGSIPVYLDSATLQGLGFDVPTGWSWSSGGGRMQAGLLRPQATLSDVVRSAIEWLIRG